MRTALCCYHGGAEITVLLLSSVLDDVDPQNDLVGTDSATGAILIDLFIFDLLS